MQEKSDSSKGPKMSHAFLRILHWDLWMPQATTEVLRFWWTPAIESISARQQPTGRTQGAPSRADVPAIGFFDLEPEQNSKMNSACNEGKWKQKGSCT